MKMFSVKPLPVKVQIRATCCLSIIKIFNPLNVFLSTSVISYLINISKVGRLELRLRDPF